MLILLMATESLLTAPLQASPESSTPSKDSASLTLRFPSSRELDLAPSSKYSYDLIFSICRKAAEAYKLSEKWAASSIAKKIALRAKRASLSDFDRFKVMINRKNRSFKLRQLAKKIAGPAGGAKKPAQKAAPAGKKK